ncbi:hypothetical protein [Parvibaculum sp.]|uniref:hypothetical protein n=1 Tax=Parvibaculum sp. TaxID=2024848 RepID=UPI003210BCD5
MRACWLACFAATLLLAGAAGAAGFTGTFIGTDAAAAMSLSLQDLDARVVGRLSLPDGRVYALNGQHRQNGVEGALRIAGAADSESLFVIEQQVSGLRLIIVPLGADGRPVMANARFFPFIPEGFALVPEGKVLAPAPQVLPPAASPPAAVAAPAPALALAPAPAASQAPAPAPAATVQVPALAPASAPAPLHPVAPTKDKVDVLRFIDEYSQWSPSDVARLYAQLGDRDRGLIQLYDHAAADILWRVCAADAAGAQLPKPVLADLIDRQQTTCAEFLPLAMAAQRSALFAEFVRRARFQFDIVRETIVCNRGQSTPSKCADMSAVGAPLIARWRDASSIMREIAGLPEGAVPPVAAQAVSLRTAIADAPETRTPPGSASTAASKDIIEARRFGIRLPLPDPRS